MRVTKKKLAGIVTTILMLLSLARVVVLFFESFASVRDERNNDLELLELCKTGSARGSSKMRAACLSARSDSASPIVLKAVVRAVSTTWLEFRENVSSPFGLITFLLFLLSSLVLPIVPWIRAATSMWASWAGGKVDADDDYYDEDVESRHSVIVLNGAPDVLGRGGLKKRFRKLLEGGGGITPAGRGAPLDTGGVIQGAVGGAAPAPCAPCPGGGGGGGTGAVE